MMEADGGSEDSGIRVDRPLGRDARPSTFQCVGLCSAGMDEINRPISLFIVDDSGYVEC